MNWIIKFANLHANMIPLELKYLLPDVGYEFISDYIVSLTTTRERIDHFIRYTSIARVVIHSPKIIKTELLYNDELDNEIFRPLFDNDIFEINLENSIAVRFYQVASKEKNLKSPVIERKISKALFSLIDEYRIDLKNPDTLYHAYRIGENVHMGWVYCIIPFADVQQRAPMNSPFFGGGALKPHLSRALVNMHQPLDCYILDPFSGHGGILREIAEMGSTAIGLEINPKLSKECKENNYFHKFQDNVLLITCDALSPPFRRSSIKMTISDPPYGLQTTTSGRGREELISRWLTMQEVGVSLVFSSPSDMLYKIPVDWELIDDTCDYVHRTLTRRIRKIIKNG